MKEEFLKVCIKNRLFLKLSVEELASYLSGVSSKEYEAFEEGNYDMSKENIERICRILCVKKPIKFNLEDHIDINSVNDEELEDISKIVEAIVGDENA